MRVARHADAPVLLVGDIDLGGVFAQMVGTLALLEPAERRLVKGLVVNKFRGDLAQFETGVNLLEERTGVPVAGVLPFLPDVRIPEEDGVGLPADGLGDSQAVLDVAVMRVPHIANFDRCALDIHDLFSIKPADRFSAMLTAKLGICQGVFTQTVRLN